MHEETEKRMTEKVQFEFKYRLLVNNRIPAIQLQINKQHFNIVKSVKTVSKGPNGICEEGLLFQQKSFFSFIYLMSFLITLYVYP